MSTAAERRQAAIDRAQKADAARAAGAGRTSPKPPPPAPSIDAEANGARQVAMVAAAFGLLPCEVEFALRDHPFTPEEHERLWPHHDHRKIR